MSWVAKLAHSFAHAGTKVTHNHQWNIKTLKLPCLGGVSTCKGWKENLVISAACLFSLPWAVGCASIGFTHSGID